MGSTKGVILAVATAVVFSISNTANAEPPWNGKIYQDVYPDSELTVAAGHFYTILGYEVIQAPDNFFYSNTLTMFNSEPFTHTGFLGNNVAGSAQIYGGWTLGWDTGFSNNERDSAGVFGGSGSLSFPVYDGINWAARVQINGAISGMQGPFQNSGIDPYYGTSIQTYIQSISGNAIGVGGGIVSESDQLDGHYYDAFALLNFNCWTSTSRFSVGEIDRNFGQKRDFFTIGGEQRFFLHQDMFSIGIVSEYGEVENERSVSYIGLNTDFAPDIQQAHTFFSRVGYVDIDYDNPLQNDRNFWFVKGGIRIDLNEAGVKSGNPLTLRARQILNSPWSGTAPYLLTYGGL